jgi:hypothetical protein
MSLSNGHSLLLKMEHIVLSAILLGSLLLAGCSRTVEWEEEVPLNTGETIIVKRSMPWIYKGGTGNPFDVAMRASYIQSIYLNYLGKEYSYTGKAQILWIAVSPNKQLVMVANPGFSGWDTENSFTCRTPYYVQFTPDTTGKQWTWSEKIDPWLNNLPANLMVNIPQLKEWREKRYSVKDRDERDARYRKETASSYLIDPLFDARDFCVKKYDPNTKPTQTWSEK